MYFWGSYVFLELFIWEWSWSMVSRMSTNRPWKQNTVANYFSYFNNLKKIFYRYRSTGKSSKNIPVLLAYLHCNEGVLWVYFSFTYQIGPKYGNVFGWFISAPVPIEYLFYAIVIWKTVRHDDLVPRPDSGHPSHHLHHHHQHSYSHHHHFNHHHYLFETSRPLPSLGSRSAMFQVLAHPVRQTQSARHCLILGTSGYTFGLSL